MGHPMQPIATLRKALLDAYKAAGVISDNLSKYPDHNPEVREYIAEKADAVQVAITELLGAIDDRTALAELAAWESRD